VIEDGGRQAGGPRRPTRIINPKATNNYCFTTEVTEPTEYVTAQSLPPRRRGTPRDAEGIINMSLRAKRGNHQSKGYRLLLFNREIREPPNERQKSSADYADFPSPAFGRNQIYLTQRHEDHEG